MHFHAHRSIVALVGWLWLCSSIASAGEVGSADLQQRIDALPPEGGEVRLAAGTITIERPILLRSGVRIIGAGPETVVLLGPTLRGPLFTDRNWGIDGCQGIEIGSLTIDGNAGIRPVSKFASSRRSGAKGIDEVEDVAVYLQRATDVRLSRLRVRQIRNEAFFLMHCDQVAITNCVITGAAMKAPTNDWSQGAIYLRHSRRCTITDNDLSDCYEGGIVAGLGSDDNYISRNSIVGSDSGEGVFIGGGDRNVVVHNRIENVSHADVGSGAGIAIAVPAGLAADKVQAVDNLIARNVIRGTGGSGISLFRADRNQVIGNTVSAANENRKPGKGGVSGWESADLVIIDNVISGSFCPGIIVRQSDRALIRGNRLQGDASPQVSIDAKAKGVDEGNNTVAP
jgi:parallel beta-helix repeat protein